MIFEEEKTTYSPPSSFLTPSLHGDLREPFKGERFWVLGNEV